mgnify:FL=1|tara:strand:+ start:50 stop:721 length:672 start_codon:yes stop_codon:yes gene_type:complete
MVGALIRKGGTWLAGRGARATTKVNVGGKFKYVSGSGDSLDDAFKGLPGVKRTAAGDGWRIPQGHMVVDDTGKVLGKGGKSFTKETWKGSYRVVKVNRLSPSVKAARSSSILSKAKSIPVPGFKNTFRFGFIAVVGYGTYRLISIIGSVSDRAEEVINNFFGIDCEEGDTVCEERGAKNMLLTGVLGITVVGGLLYMSLKPKGKEDKQEVEIKISKDEAATAA